VKEAIFMGSSGDDLRRFPFEARQRAGYQLYLVQMGADPSDWKPMASIGPGCPEIRVRSASDAYRVIYVATIGDALYVLHCFQKKTRQTAKADIDVAKQRYKQMTQIERAREAP
jgi:phage-related protein